MLNISSTDCRDPESWTIFTLIVVCLLIVSVKTQMLVNRKLFMPVMSLSTTSVVNSRWICILKTFSLMTPSNVSYRKHQQLVIYRSAASIMVFQAAAAFHRVPDWESALKSAWQSMRLEKPRLPYPESTEFYCTPCDVCKYTG